MPKAQRSNAPQISPSLGKIRIISGLWRGRKLPVHDVQGLRPTSDRIKETLFNWLAMDIAQARCLDLFAGAGGLGFEAASRFAQQVTMVELHPAAARQLNENVARLQAKNIEVVQQDAVRFLQQSPEQPYQVVFLDPPFHQDLLQDCVTALEANRWLAPNALIYIESERQLDKLTVPSLWHLHRDKTAGQVCYQLYIREI